MLVTKTVTKEVTACKECPWFQNHPYEATCELKRNRGAKGWDDIVVRDTIDTTCPLL